MGTVIKRVFAALALAALLVPAGAHASSVVTIAPPWADGPRGGDSFNTIMSDGSTGDMTVLRVNPAGTSSGLGCGGTGGFANFETTYTPASPVTAVTVSYSDAIVDPYTWINVGVRQGDAYVTSRVERGILAGGGVVTVAMPSPVSGPITVWFGLQVASACPNVDGGHAVFNAVGFELQ